MKKFLLHPYLFALYPVIFLYSKNIKEYTEESVLMPIIVSLIFAGIVFFIAKLIFKKVNQAAVISSYIIFICLSYGRLLGIFKLTQQTTTFIVIAVALLVLVVVLVKRYQKALPKVNEFLTYVVSIMLIFSLFNIVTFEAKTGRLFTKRDNAQILQNKNAKVSEDTPDIYYFIFDRYAGPASLTGEYSVDNSEFLTFLKDKGFYIADQSRTNYPKTFLSLGSSLNMEYLDYLTEQTNGGASPDQSIVTPLIRNSKVIKFLKDKGYYYINIGPKTWKPTSFNPNADVNYQLKDGAYPLMDPFGTGYLNMTIAEPIFKEVFKNPLDVSIKPDTNEHRRLAVFELDAIEKTIPVDGPKFVFAHVLLPHDPFVFDRNCNPVSEKQTDKNDHITNYVEQLKCANIKMEKIISDILTKSKRPPVIILQSDQGPFPMKGPIAKNEPWIDATDTALHEKFPILNAYYFPGKETSMLYPSISPVNSFRVLFNTYFGESFPLLPDRSYIFQDNENYYKFTDVTQRVK